MCDIILIKESSMKKKIALMVLVSLLVEAGLWAVLPTEAFKVWAVFAGGLTVVSVAVLLFVGGGEKFVEFFNQRASTKKVNRVLYMK